MKKGEITAQVGQLIVNEKSQNLRRLQAQRNELNAKGKAQFLSPSLPEAVWPALLWDRGLPARLGVLPPQWGLWVSPFVC